MDKQWPLITDSCKLVNNYHIILLMCIQYNTVRPLWWSYGLLTSNHFKPLTAVSSNDTLDKMPGVIKAGKYAKGIWLLV